MHLFCQVVWYGYAQHIHVECKWSEGKRNIYGWREWCNFPDGLTEILFVWWWCSQLGYPAGLVTTSSLSPPLFMSLCCNRNIYYTHLAYKCLLVCKAKDLASASLTWSVNVKWARRKKEPSNHVDDDTTHQTLKCTLAPVLNNPDGGLTFQKCIIQQSDIFTLFV